MRAAPLALAITLLSACSRGTQGSAIPLPTPGRVLLLRHPIELTPAIAAAQLKAAFKRDFPILPSEHPGPDPPDFVAPQATHLQIAIDRTVFRVTQLNRPYVEDVYRWPFIKDHQAWLAADSLSPNTEPALVRLLNALAPPGVVAVYFPADDRMVPTQKLTP